MAVPVLFVESSRSSYLRCQSELMGALTFKRDYFLFYSLLNVEKKFVIPGEHQLLVLSGISIDVETQDFVEKMRAKNPNLKVAKVSLTEKDASGPYDFIFFKTGLPYQPVIYEIKKYLAHRPEADTAYT